MKISSVLSEDRNIVTITLFEGDNPLGHASVEAPELEALISLLSANRSEMADPVPFELEPGSRLIAMLDPIWRTKVPSSAPPDHVALVLRHPGLGWITALLPNSEAANLGQSLLDLSKQQSP